MTKNTFKARRIFASALLTSASVFSGGAVILAPTASADSPAGAQVQACIKTAESISVPGHSQAEVFISCCHSFGGVVVPNGDDGKISCHFPESPSQPSRTTGTHLPIDVTHI